MVKLPQIRIGAAMRRRLVPRTVKELRRRGYRLIEPRIRPLVRYLNRLGVPTVWSCGGHGRWDPRRLPWYVDRIFDRPAPVLPPHVVVATETWKLMWSIAAACAVHLVGPVLFRKLAPPARIRKRLLWAAPRAKFWGLVVFPSLAATRPLPKRGSRKGGRRQGCTSTGERRKAS